MARPHIEGAHAPLIEPLPLAAHAAGWPQEATIRPLSHDPVTGAVTGIVTLPRGSVREPAALAAEVDVYLTAGTLRVGDRRTTAGWYEYAPGGSLHERWVAEEECELFLMARDRAPDVVAASARDTRHFDVQTEAMSWEVTPIPGMPGGIYLKVLRAVAETGESVFILGVVPGWELDLLEYHDMDEECFIVDGDVWIGHAGPLGPGSYFCRPSYTTHGPFYTRNGFMALQWTSTHVANHFTENPLATREQNRRAAKADPPLQDHLSSRAVGARDDA